MCGICGIIDLDENQTEENRLRSMLSPLERREPDEKGWLIQPGAAPQRSPHIIDLTDKGRQPMTDEELGLSVVYSGKIYNYRELKRNLTTLGYRFFSDSDTEVLLKAYHAWGDAFVTRLSGMFAFCLYDRNRRRCLLGRDRLGVKPLYFVDAGDTFYFASNIQSLKRAGAVRPILSKRALHYYLSFHGVIPAPWTIFENVRKLEPATLLVIDAKGRKRKQTYWTLNFDEKRQWSEEEWVERLLHTLEASVRRQMESDVPVGALLSGGVDSSMIVALMARMEPGSLRTYSIGFEDVAGEAGNEFRYSDRIAELFGTDHRKIYIDSKELLSHLKDCIRSMAEPMTSHDAVAFYLLSREVSRETRAVLSGQGADEVFAGYHWYPRINDGSGHPADRYEKAFFDRDHTEIREMLGPEYRGDNWSRQFVHDHFGLPGASHPVDKALRLDTTVMLVDDPLKRVDNMTTCWGLQARVPFLDHELVELAAAMPPEIKLAGGGKAILKKAAERLIPREVIYRKKGYFPVPALKYLRGEYLEFAREVLLSERARRRGLFSPEYVEKLLAAPENHITPLGGSKLWQIALLEYWLEEMGC
ncbi:MAG: N-acetylglutaminylglutamine amidotransferase [Planifilum sp.]|mgnify:CR=1 FL=1|jgi:asparagine synthase (glutamine-hydrolysing)